MASDRLSEINKRALQVELPWNLEIDNATLVSESTIGQLFKRLLSHHGHIASWDSSW
ncbi:hypothetical protein [Almyronema epifaneia]|uniref:Uncharacterized protein n=1 Tax=Almyronema epifaneia S1 TaxID=2991925 RepID=A0ABW6IGV5_9CYAN